MLVRLLMIVFLVLDLSINSNYPVPLLAHFNGNNIISDNAVNIQSSKATKIAEKTPWKKRVAKKALNCICGRKASNIRKIVGGSISRENAHPWIAALIYVGRSKPTQFCGSSLINDRYVLTAAHCVFNSVDQNIKDYMVYVGTNQINNTDNKNKYNIASVITHPRFNKGTLDYDIALIKLSKPVTLSNTVKTICLTRPGLRYTGRVTNVAGWGTQGSGGTPVNQLRETRVKVITNSDCVNKYSTSKVKITPNMVCASLPGSDSCSGDSGGPMVLKDSSDDTMRQVGIVSFGIDCANAKYPGVYTRVSRFTNWIKDNTGGGQYCSKSF